MIRIAPTGRVLAVAAAASLALTACGGGGGDTAAKQSESAAPSTAASSAPAAKGDGTLTLGTVLPQMDRVSDPQLKVHALVEAAYLHNEIGQYRLGLHYAERILSDHPDSRARCFAEFLKYDAMMNLSALPADNI